MLKYSLVILSYQFFCSWWQWVIDIKVDPRNKQMLALTYDGIYVVSFLVSYRTAQCWRRQIKGMWCYTVDNSILIHKNHFIINIRSLGKMMFENKIHIMSDMLSHEFSYLKFRVYKFCINFFFASSFLNSKIITVL